MAKVLVADDDADIRQLVRELLEKNKHQVFETATGSDTLEFLKAKPADLLVLDVMMPGMDGYALQMQLAQDPKTRNIPVVVISALKPAEGMFAKFPQVRGFLLKPFEPGEFLKTVDSLLKAPAAAKGR
jgi:CheY-like chemotaxis protein